MDGLVHWQSFPIKIQSRCCKNLYVKSLFFRMKWWSAWIKRPRFFSWNFGIRIMHFGRYRKWSYCFSISYFRQNVGTIPKIHKFCCGHFKQEWMWYNHGMKRWSTLRACNAKYKIIINFLAYVALRRKQKTQLSWIFCSILAYETFKRERKL